MMDEKEKSHAAAWWTALACAPVLYVLSVGPVAMCCKAMGMKDPPEWLEKFYAPIQWAGEHSEAFDWLLEKYGKALHLDD